MKDDLRLSELYSRGIAPGEAEKILSWIDSAHQRNEPEKAWSRISSQILTPAHAFSLHAWLYEQCYGTDAGPAWLPSAEVVERANVTAAAKSLGLADYASLHRWSAELREAYWALAIERLGIRFSRSYAKIVDATEPTRPKWLIGAAMNIVESCFQAGDDKPAIIEGGQSASRTWTYGELKKLTARVAHGLAVRGVKPGDAVGVVMPMTPRSVAIYLGIIAAGAVVVSIADSFAAEEIATRLRLAGAKLAFTQDVVPWAAKQLPLYAKMVEAKAPATIVLAAGEKIAGAIRAGDFSFDNFLSTDDSFKPVPRSPQEPINILFSSGTTGEPKAIPWDHTVPIKCAADAHFHQDIHPGDVTCWPTNLGWMMGPWLIFATLINRATMALYAQAPTDAGFGRFVSEARVNMLGLVPSLVRAWRQSECMRGIDWSTIRAFSSSGECSNPADMLYLMHLAGYRPIIEYCGGTEIGGGYVSGTVVQPCIPATFTTAALGLDIVLLDDDRKPARKGEVFIVGPSIGLSTRLLNRDHDAIYFADAPLADDGTPLRKHGDELQKLRNGYYRVAGRSDDTMNLGGIKVGCAEIERVLNPLQGVQETAAIAVAPPGGGPSRLVIFVVPKAGDPITADALKPIFQQAIRAQLNPLFHVAEVRLIDSLPRTTSNKVMRRELRAKY